MKARTKISFFRQSGWLVIATGVCGVFLMAVYSVVQKLPDLGSFLSMLRFFTVLGIVTSGLQVVMARQAAAAVTEGAQRELAETARTVARAIVLIWAGLAAVCWIFQDWLIATLKIPHAGTLAITLGLVLAQLFLPFAHGLLQGAQQFGWLGWSIILNGAGRFVAIAVLTLAFGGTATIALGGALAGLCASVLAGLWPSRGLIFGPREGGFAWRPWLRQALPLAAGTGSILFLMNADVLFVQAHFPARETAYYSAVAIVGLGLVTFTTPMAAVMFPKLVRSVAQAESSDSLSLALAGTAVLGVIGAAFCTLWPELPLRIMYFKNPDLWKSAQLVPWFMWSMLPLTVANVVIGSLLARGDFRVTPWLAVLAAGYGLELSRYLGGAGSLELFAAFKGVVLRLGVFSVAMLCAAAFFTRRARGSAGR